MAQVTVESLTLDPEPKADYEVVIIGAGITGLYQLHILRTLGVSVRLFEAGGGVGGTWYWNRYPGCRLDSESYSYQYAFDDDVLANANWSELFASQPELERYLNDVADRLNLRPDIQLNSRVESMVFDEDAHSWAIHLEGGGRADTKLVICATGILSAPNYPVIPGLDNFEGELYHTALWPDKNIDFAGKRVAVIGTGASGIQLIPHVAATAAHLTVFQRTPNWAVPLRNTPLGAKQLAEIRDGYPAMFAQLRVSANGFLHDWDPRVSSLATDEERNAKFEQAWASPGFAKWFGMYRDIATDPVANRRYCDFIASKIRERVTDPEVAEALIPKDHLFGTKRVPCETDYYETYNRHNVELVRLNDNPILEFTLSGLTTAEGPSNFDMIILATGFDAFTGAMSRIDIRGVRGLTLRDKWKNGPRTYMGLQVAGFPNLFIVGGPHGKGGHGNSPRCSEPVIEWLADLVHYLRHNGVVEIEAEVEAEHEWTEHIYDLAAKSLGSGTASYSYGDNIPGKAHAYVAYQGTLVDFVERLEQSRSHGYADFRLLRRGTPADPSAQAPLARSNQA